MIKELKSPKTNSIIQAVTSKSEIHRLLICSALADGTTKVFCKNTNNDIDATVSCLNSLGADIVYSDGVFTVNPIKNASENESLFCNESGSTLRFLLPLAAYFGKNYTFETRGRLAQRPLSPLKEELETGGATIVISGNEIKVSGKCEKTNFSIAADVSSQFISGLMFMLSRTGGEITLYKKTESRHYIEMTAQALEKFGCNVNFSGNKITVQKQSPLISPKEITGGGDWSNAAFFITAGIIGKEKITVSGLDADSRQGDSKIIDILRTFGGKIQVENGLVTSFPSKLTGTQIDATDIPDLVPVLSIAAAVADGTTRIYGCSRLRLKESDRIESVKNMLTSLGVKVHTVNDDIIIEHSDLTGGTVNSENDHRIAMSAAVAAFATDKTVTVIDAQAVNKSYPSFWDEIR